jgi:hypothetical protein
VACEPPEVRDVALSRWSSLELAVQAMRRAGRVDLVVDRAPLAARGRNQALALSVMDLPTPPRLATKAARVLDLYGRVFDGVALGPHDYVISADEKSQLQALCRCHLGHPAGPGQRSKVEFEYERGGTLAYMGAYDVHRALLIGDVAEMTGIVPFMELAERVMTTEPYPSATNV